jgi:hypothetical protein
MFVVNFKIDQMKTITLFILFLPLVLFSQWTFKTVNNGFDTPYKIAHTAENNDALLKLEPVEVEVPLTKKYPIRAGMFVFETTYEHSISGGLNVDLGTGLFRNNRNVFSGEIVVIAGQTSLDTNGVSKKYYLLYDGSNQLFCEQSKIKFPIPVDIGSFEIRSGNSVDSLIQIAKQIHEQSKTVPQLYEKQLHISFYLSGGYHCDDEIPVDISFMVAGQFVKFSVNGVKSSNSKTVFLIDDLLSSEMKDAFLKASIVKLRFNESHCQSDYYEFKMSGSTAALNFVSKP